MNVCMLGYCICGAAEYEGDTNCNTYYGLPEEWDIRAERERMEAERNTRLVSTTRTRMVNNPVDRNSLPEFTQGIFMGGIEATDRQKDYIFGLLDAKHVPDKSFRVIARTTGTLPARYASRVIDYLTSLPYKMKAEEYVEETRVVENFDRELRIWTRQNDYSYWMNNHDLY